MKHLLTLIDSTQVGLARSVLEAAEIPCEVRNETVSQAFPSLPFAPELWVREQDYEEAKRLLDDAQPPETSV